MCYSTSIHFYFKELSFPVSSNEKKLITIADLFPLLLSMLFDILSCSSSVQTTRNIVTVVHTFNVYCFPLLVMAVQSISKKFKSVVSIFVLR